MNNILVAGVAAVMLAYGIPACAQDNPYARWEETIAAFEKADRENPPSAGSVLFVGSSSVRMWKSLVEDMAPLPVINRGFGGSKIDDCVHFAERIVTPYRPSAILLYAGDNDIAAGNEPERLLADFKRFVDAVRKTMPDTPVYFLSVKPSISRWNMWPSMKRANALIERYTIEQPHLAYIDVSTPMLESAGSVRKDLFLDDGLHMNGDGYALWTAIVRPRLEAFMEAR